MEVGFFLGLGEYFFCWGLGCLYSDFGVFPLRFNARIHVFAGDHSRAAKVSATE